MEHGLADVIEGVDHGGRLSWIREEGENFLHSLPRTACSCYCASLVGGLVSGSNIQDMQAILLPILLSGALISPLTAQSAVRDGFPTSHERGNLYEYFTNEQWESSNYASTAVMKEWQDRRYGMFIHYGITSKANKDLSWGSIATRYAPDSPGITANGQKRTEEWT